METSSQITVFVKTVSGEKTSIPTTSSTTVLDFKGLVEEHMKIPKAQQRIIFAGHILKDERTLESYGIKDGLSVILVKTTAPATSTPTSSSSSTTTSTSTSTSTPITTTQPTPVTITSTPLTHQSTPPTTTTTTTPTTPPPLTQPTTFPFSLGGGGLNPTAMQQQLLQNPNLMREMMNSPIIQQMLQNPELLRSIWMSNPQMRELIERNPEIGHVLNDPAILRQTIEAARNPELMRELMRNSDRAVSHLETLPEGFNFLRRMYSDVQEPLMQAATGTGETPPPSTSETPSTPTPVNPTPNTAPLPNPWQASAQGSTTPSTGPSLGGAGGGGLFPSMGLGGMDPNQLNSMLQNPQMQAAVQSMLSNPALMSTMQQMMERDPHYQQLLQANPQLRSMMTNPELLQQMTNPNTLQALQQIQSGMSQLQNQGVLPMLMPQMGQTGSGTNPTFDMSQLFNSLSGFTGTGVPPSTATPTTTPTPSVPQDPETRFRNQLQQLREMGFYDTQRNIQLLLQNNGDVNRTIDQLLNY